MSCSAIVSDLHFNNIHEGLWKNFLDWGRYNRPREVVVLGDLLDLEMFSVYMKGAKSPVKVLPEIRRAVAEVNKLLTFSKNVYVVGGNHDQRWEKAILGPHAQKLEGLLGLTLEEQMRAQGLDSRVKWIEESPEIPGLVLGDEAILCRHGHKQASKWGVIHLSAKLLNEQPTISTIVGHHHRAQMAVRTYYQRQVYGLANPHMSGHHDYNPLPNWQRGFSVLEWLDRKTFTPYVVVADLKGRFAYGGRVYGKTA